MTAAEPRCFLTENQPILKSQDDTMPKNTTTKSNAGKGAVTSSNKGGNPASKGGPAGGKSSKGGKK